jgi:hypothetical protein
MKRRLAEFSDGVENGSIEMSCPDVVFVNRHRNLLEHTVILSRKIGSLVILAVRENKICLSVPGEGLTVWLASDNASSLLLGYRGHFKKKSKLDVTGSRQLTRNLDTHIDLPQSLLENIVQRRTEFDAHLNDRVFSVPNVATVVLSYLVFTFDEDYNLGFYK